MDGAESNRRLLGSARTVSVLTLLSRVLGLVRDMATAALLGSSWVNDALNYAWTLPNAFRRLFGEGALSSAFVPIISRVVEQEGRERAREVANAVISAMGLFLLLLAGSLVALVGLLPEERVAGWFGVESAERAAVLVRYIQIVLPYLAGVCVVAQFMAVLNVLGEFTVPALAQVIVNLVWIAGVAAAAFLAPEDLPVRGEVIAWSVLVAAVLQFLWHLPRLAAMGVGFRLVRPRVTPELRAVLALLLPMLVGMGAGQLAVLADSHIAMLFLGEGGRTHIYYGMRVMQFPMGLVAVALGTVVYPLLSRMMARGDRGEAASAAALALRTDLLLTLPAAVGLLLLARPIVGLLFEHGQFGAAAGDLTARALAGYALGIPTAGAVILLTRASYALGNTALPVRVGLLMLVINVALDLLLVTYWQEFGLALATSLTSAISALLLFFGVRRLLGQLDELRPAALAPLLLTTALMGLGVWALDRWLEARLGGGSWADLLRVAAGVVVGVALFGVLAARLCRREWSELSGLWRRRRA
jgi:putative peptidoglycan lipid II flippase